ncbi:MAG: hypothetical protein LC644_09715 [Pseudonocardia sp.]|nr:hypothetical protein [Pseudonocardia sp.]
MANRTPRYYREGVLTMCGGTIMGVILVLLVVWLALVIIGFVVKALLWLAIAGIVLFVATGIYGAIRSRTR